MNVGITVAIAWLPLFLLSSYIKKFYPSEDQKIMMQAKSKKDLGCLGKICDLVTSCLKKKKRIDDDEMKQLMDELNG